MAMKWLTITIISRTTLLLFNQLLLANSGYDVSQMWTTGIRGHDFISWMPFLTPNLIDLVGIPGCGGCMGRFKRLG